MGLPLQSAEHESAQSTSSGQPNEVPLTSKRMKRKLHGDRCLPDRAIPKRRNAPLIYQVTINSRITYRSEHEGRLTHIGQAKGQEQGR